MQVSLVALSRSHRPSVADVFNQPPHQPPSLAQLAHLNAIISVLRHGIPVRPSQPVVAVPATRLVPPVMGTPDQPAQAVAPPIAAPRPISPFQPPSVFIPPVTAPDPYGGGGHYPFHRP